MGTDDKVVIPENLRLPFNRASLSEIRVALNRLQARLGFSDGCGLALRLVLEELVTNSIMHGWGKGAHDDPETGIHVDFHIDDGVLHFRYVDHGSPFDPRSDLPSDSRDEHLDDRPDGQLGWPLILHYCDLLHYAREEGQNRMHLRLREKVLNRD
ncbi:ATP-binding protein [Hwanghaeella grinnelliae]|nr:ATP-binding protein [Hwanghaeella grinnelliae]